MNFPSRVRNRAKPGPLVPQGVAILSGQAFAETDAMSKDLERGAYPSPPIHTPAPNPKPNFFNPIDLIEKVFYYVVDRPVTAFREWKESQRTKNKIYYYHREFRRVPDLTECKVDDYLCIFEAEMQWKRDHQVDREIVKIMRERLSACKVLEGTNAPENCSGELQLFKEVAKAYRDRYDELGAHGTARTCLMKQKHRMIKERKAQAKAEAEAKEEAVAMAKAIEEHEGFCD